MKNKKRDLFNLIDLSPKLIKKLFLPGKLYPQAMPKVPRYFGRWLRLGTAMSLSVKLEVLIINRQFHRSLIFAPLEMPFVLVDLPDIVMYNRFVC